MAIKNQHFCDSSIVESYDLHIESSNTPLIIICLSNEHAERVAYTLSEMRNADTFIIPENETLPYDEEFPQPSITSLRFKNINRLLTSIKKEDIFLIPVRAMVEKICDQNLYLPNLSISYKADFDAISIKDELVSLGYKEKSTVRDLGDFSIHPNVFEIFSFGEELPVRIYLKNKPDEFGSMNYFSSESLLNLKNVNEVKVYPTREFPFDDSAINKFKVSYRKLFGNVKNDFVKSIKEGILPRGVDYFKTLFSDKNQIIADLLPKTTRVICLLDINEQIRNIHNKFETRYHELKDYRDVLEPSYLLGSIEDLHSTLEVFEYNNDSNKESLGIIPNGISKQEKMHQTFSLIMSAHNETKKTLITINTETRLKQLEIMFKMKGLAFEEIESWGDFNNKKTGFFVLKSDIDIGYINKKKGFTIITEFEIFSSKTNEEGQSNNSFQGSNILELEEGDPVVHSKYGVGRFVGFETFSDEKTTKEYAIIKYAESSNIWVSLDDMHLLSEYKGIDPENVPLDNASSKNWGKHLNNAIKDVKSMASKLIKIKAKRKLKKREPFKIPAFEYRKFSNEFPFTITQDQGTAINDILNDLKGDISMDRVVVGDVGYGKTEVAMRAAMIVAFNKRQCCIVAPTTLLAEQHFESFKSRFQGFNFNIKLLTRDSKSVEKSTLADLENGNIDIIIGTHRLIQKDVKFKNIGLFVIDEEHRFGVAQKEDINQRRGSVDLLSLSATPIPRTLSLTMHGIRDISTIRTAPQKRLAIRTASFDYDESVIKEALRREMGRNGQAFYIHNNVSTIEETCNLISTLLPDARVNFAHGKMKQDELQKIMQNFRDHNFDILVATTIIETGIDIPNVNTIILEDCDKFGLAQMHQLRGRVGRSNKQAYAYLLKPKERVMSETAIKRLKAMEGNNNLGGGFKISNADLEIRGAGEVLGENQSGHIQEVGYQMYFSLLERAVAMLENGEDLSELSNTDDPLIFYIPSSHSIPTEFIKNKGLRASYYKALSEAKSEDKLHEIVNEMSQRFGTLPLELKKLVELFKGKLVVMKLGVKKTKINKTTLEIKFDNEINKEVFVKAFESKDLISIESSNLTISVPLNNFDRDGVVDYPKIANCIIN
jgi:transcription-repair coupling factor (superfamily II helicase)